MLEKLKKYVNYVYARAEKSAKTWEDIENYRARAYGALMFCIDSDLVNYDEVSEYWNVMWEKFFKLREKFVEQIHLSHGPAAELADPNPKIFSKKILKRG